MDKLSGSGGGVPPMGPGDKASSSSAGVQKTKTVSGAVLKSQPQNITITTIQLANVRPIDQSINAFIKSLPSDSAGIQRAINQWIGENKKDVEELYKANYRIVALGDLPLSQEQQIKHNRITAAIIAGAPDLNTEHLNRTERIAYLVKHMSMGGVRFDAASGKYVVSNFAVIRDALKSRKIPFMTRGSTESSASHLFLDGKNFDRLIDGLYASDKAVKKLNQDFANHFKDSTGNWGVELVPDEELDFYTIKIPEGPDSMRKKYSVFVYFKEAGLIPENQVFTKEVPLPRIAGSELPRLVDGFKVQNDLKELLTGLLGEIDPEIKIQSGGASAANFYSEALAQNPDYFTNELKINKDCVSEIRKEAGSLVYPAAIQIQTKSDQVMKLLESYYKEFNFIAKDKKDKTFIAQTRDPGKLHISNLNQEQYYRIKQRCNRLLFIHKEMENTPHPIPTSQLMQQEINGTMLQTYVRMRMDKIRSFIEHTPIDNKPRALAEMEKLRSATSYSDLLDKEKSFWKGCLNKHSEIDAKGLAPLASESISPASITEKLYDNRRDLTDMQKVEKLCQRLRGNHHLTAHSSSALINRNIEELLIVAREKVRTSSGESLVKTGIQLLEQIVYRMEYADLPAQRINQFFNTLMGIEWRGCSEGFAEKIQELLIQLGAEESADQALFDMRNGLVSEFVNIHYGADSEIAMYLGGIQASLNHSLGLGRTFQAPSGWGAGHVDDGLKYVMSNYTPDEIYKAIYHEKNEKVGAAIAQGTSAAIESVLTELGVEDMERYYDPITAEYNIPAMQFDMPFLVLNYCTKNNYLKWGTNRSIAADYERAAYNRRIRGEEASRHAAAPARASSGGGGGGGGCGGGMN